MQAQKRKLKPVIVVLAVLLALCVAALVGTIIIGRARDDGPETFVVPGNIIDPEPEQSAEGLAASSEVNSLIEASSSAGVTGEPIASEVTGQAVYLHAANADENTAFSVSNMFPGDSEVKYFRVRVKHKGDVTLRYHADIRPGYEKLAEVLKVKIELPGEGATLYDGLMRDMPASLNKALAATSVTESEVYYKITAYLDTSVGNDYMAKDLIADFRWWVEETGNLVSPQTGDRVVWVIAGVAVVSLAALLILLLTKRKKEASDEEGK